MTTTTATVTYYFADSYAPTAPTAITGTQPTWAVGLTDGATPATNVIEYILYDDTTLWDLWVAWANYNKFTGNTNNADYSSLVFGMNGKWPTLGNDVLNDGMCVVDAKSGSTSEGAAQCIVTDKSAIPATKTYHCTAA